MKFACVDCVTGATMTAAAGATMTAAVAAAMSAVLASPTLHFWLKYRINEINICTSYNVVSQF